MNGPDTCGSAEWSCGGGITVVIRIGLLFVCLAGLPVNESCLAQANDGVDSKRVKLLVSSGGTDSILAYYGRTGEFIRTFASGGGLETPRDFAFGPDGNLYAVSWTNHNVVRFNGQTGAFMDVFITPSGGYPREPFGIAFGPTGDLFLGEPVYNRVLRFSGQTGEYKGTFIPSGTGGLLHPVALLFPGDGLLYVTSSTQGDNVRRYNELTGAYVDAFVATGSGGLDGPQDLEFGPDGNLYVTSYYTREVIRYDGTSGAFVDVFVSAGSGGLNGARGLGFGPDNNLCVASCNTHEILQYDGQTGAFLGALVSARSGGLEHPYYFLFREMNLPPSPPVVQIEPNKPTDEDDLLASVSGSTDPEEDNIHFSYTWLENGVPIESDGIHPVDGPALSHVYTTPGRTITCVVTPDDGELEGTPSSASAKIQYSTTACDSGYYILDSFGGRQRVGNPYVITGSLYFGSDIARDMERAVCGPPGSQNADLVVLDGYGAAHFVTGAECSIPQVFYFGDSSKDEFPEGRAVDIEMSSDSQGFWVLTDYGGTYCAGTARDPDYPALVRNTDRSGILGFDVPFGEMRAPNLPEPGGASLRAVSLAVIDTDQNSRADGYLILDSQGGRFHLDPEGTPFTDGISAGLPENDPLRLLDPSGYVWPFFPGLDIARDMELFSTQEGVVILDGWDGIHPVPVEDESNAVYFANNRVSNANPTPLQDVGLPYIVHGFDDPDTLEYRENETEFGIDAESIFTDLEFTAGCDDGLYTLDKFGGVFALGSAREIDEEPIPQFGDSPYFYPFLYAEDMELFAGNETGFPRGSET